MGRDAILHRIRTALGRSVGQECPPPPAPMLEIPEVAMDDRIAMFFACVEKLAGKTHRAASAEDARSYAAGLIGGRSAVMSNAPFLRECGLETIPGISTGVSDTVKLRELCATAAVGVTSADYALADTGTLVMIASPHESRLVSLLPPVHLAIVPKERMLTGLDELLTVLPKPAETTSAMVFITGPSRTADIEQILVRGVHGPGEIHVVVV